ncbi:hypothetical protein ACXJJ3_08915 [Kribbella sp. WER1]
MKQKTVRSGDIARCPIKSLLPDHYNEDGTCECPSVNYCLRCGKDTSSEVVMTAFRRRGQRFVPVPGVVLCMACGANGANTLTDNERRSLGLTG